jgi:hypothetical protein
MPEYQLLPQTEPNYEERKLEVGYGEESFYVSSSRHHTDGTSH